MARLTAAPIAASSAGQRATGGRLRTLDRGPTSPWPRQRINGHRSALTWFCRRFVGAPGRGRVASCSWCAGAGPSRRWVVRDIPRVRRARGAADGETTNEAGPPAPPPIASPWAPQVDPPAATRVRASRRSGSVFACVLLSRGWRSTVRVVALPETRSPLHRRGRDGCFAGRVRCRGRARTRWLALLLLRPGVVHSWRVTCVGVRCIVHGACFRTLLGHELDVEERYRLRNDRVYRFFWRLGLFPADIRNQHGLRRVSV